MSNGLTSFTLGDDGTIADLCWPEGAAALCEGFAGLVRYPDVAANFDAWDLDRHTLSVGEPCDGPADITPFDGPDGAAGWSVRRTVGDESSVDVRLFLKPVSAELHIEILLDWRDPEAMLKLHLPTRYRARQARFGAPFGSVLRSQVPDGPVSAAMWEVPFSRHLSVFEEGETRGMAVIAESLYGASVYEGAVGLTLIRSPRVTGREGMHCESWPPALSRISDESPVFSDLGEHTIRLALSNVGPAFPASRHPAALCDTLFTAPCRYVGSPLEAPFTWARLDPTVVPAWVKPLNGGSLLVRLHEANGKSAQFALRCHAPYRAAIADFAGQALGDLAQTVTHQLSPYEIATVRLDPS